MTDATDDLDNAGVMESTYCWKHKAGRGLWPHECLECQKTLRLAKAKKSITGGTQTKYHPTHWMYQEG